MMKSEPRKLASMKNITTKTQGVDSGLGFGYDAKVIKANFLTSTPRA